MNETDALDLLQYAIWTIIIVSSPGVIVAMLAGLIIGILQALTQIQEAALTFVPKVLGVLVAVLWSAYFMGSSIAAFATFAYSRVETGF